MGDHDLPHGDILKEKIEKRLAEYPESVLQEAGHQLDDMLLKCQYDSSMECMDNFRDLWTQLWHPKYGNCFSFNRGRTGNGKALQLLTSSIPGHDNGLQLELNAEQYEYVSELTDEAGIRVFIGTQNVMPFPYELGISVAPGYSTGVMLRKIVIGKLDPFNNDSCEPRSELEGDNYISTLRYVLQ
ncbi:ligand-gated sodium channel [Porites harrisoni]